MGLVGAWLGVGRGTKLPLRIALVGGVDGGLDGGLVGGLDGGLVSGLEIVSACLACVERL